MRFERPDALEQVIQAGPQPALPAKLLLQLGLLLGEAALVLRGIGLLQEHRRGQAAAHQAALRAVEAAVLAVLQHGERLVGRVALGAPPLRLMPCLVVALLQLPLHLEHAEADHIQEMAEVQVVERLGVAFFVHVEVRLGHQTLLHQLLQGALKRRARHAQLLGQQVASQVVEAEQQVENHLCRVRVERGAHGAHQLAHQLPSFSLQLSHGASWGLPPPRLVSFAADLPESLERAARPHVVCDGGAGWPVAVS
eukprot:scaffold2584_cov231-Pinguiococcus_pyrenoidosus.AAC.1